MSENREREALFDHWANGYDEAVRTCDGFPFAGYEAVLDEIVRRADPEPGQRVLDLGIGTGALAHRFELLGCEVWGIDFSADMLAKANARCPTAHTLQGDLLATWPSGIPHQFDRIVSGYVFHEFALTDKRLLIERSLRRLAPGGRLIIGDIAFTTATARSKAREKWEDVWDSNEHYWAWDETKSLLTFPEWTPHYTQVSECGGVLCV
ncbi:class I SAM-dependent DNA methyltransferase [Candidatus Bipolaricaulota bacterium]